MVIFHNNENNTECAYSLHAFRWFIEIYQRYKTDNFSVLNSEIINLIISLF
jgi:hypothetical protein